MIYLLRHGEIEQGPGRRFIGQVDCQLSAKGLQQAEQWRLFFRNLSLQDIFCSDLLRSRQTAEIIAGVKRKRLRVDPRLREIYLGDWENQEMAAIKEAFPEAWERRGRDLAGYRPPGGESFEDLCDRVWPFFVKLASTLQGDLLIIGHAGVNRVLLCRILGMPLQNLFRLGQDFGTLNQIEYSTGFFRVQSLNSQVFNPFKVPRGVYEG